jgi:hypothetical protein
VAADYALPTVAAGAVGQIDPKQLAVTLAAPIEKTYDGLTTATLTSANYSVTGFIGAETGTVTQTAGVYASQHAGTSISVTASLAASNFSAGTGTTAGDYALPTTASGAVGKIDPKALAVALTGTVEKTYDGATTATLTSANYSVTGFVGTETATVTQASGAYAQADVKATPPALPNISVSVTLASGDFSAGVGTQLTDYVLPTGALSGVVGQIDPKSITASLTSVKKTYDGTTTATLSSGGYTLVGVLAADTSGVTLTGTGVYTAGKDAGTSLNVSFSSLGLSGAKAGDYTLSSTTASSATAGEIDAKTITAAVSGSVEKTYDGGTLATLGTSYTLPGVLQGDSVTLTSTSGAYASANAAPSVGVSFSGLALGGPQAADYTLSSATMSSTTAGVIDKKVLTAALLNTVTAEKTYDGTSTVAVAAADFSLPGVIGPDQVSLSNTSSGTLDTIHVGTNKTVTVTESLTGAQAGNYSLASSTLSAGIGQVDAKVLTANLTGTVEKTYDTTAAATVTSGMFTLVGGVVGNDQVNIGTVGSANYASANAGSGISVTASGLALGGANAGDYALSATTATGATVGVIDKKALTVTLVGLTEKTFDGTTTATLTPANFQLNGVLGTDSVTLVEPTTGAYATTLPGTGIKVTVTGLSLTGGSAGNYSVSTGSGNIGTIDKNPGNVRIGGGGHGTW